MIATPHSKKWQKNNREERRDCLLRSSKDKFSKKIGSFSLIERVILSAGAMLIFSVSFQN
jgi:hypothetical protein